jgi:hypothetical protein
MPMSGRVRLPRKGRQPPESCLPAGAPEPQNANHGMKIECLRHALCYRHSDGLRQSVGHPALCPLMTDLRQASDPARAIAAAALGRDPGPMTAAKSSSHYVYVGSDVVVKIIDADGHSRLDREIALAPRRPHGPAARQRALPARDARGSLRLLRPRAGDGSPACVVFTPVSFPGSKPIASARAARPALTCGST